MTDLKFECPSCGQNLECSRACGGDAIHCPRCCAEIRVPFAVPGEIEGTVARAELIAPPPKPEAGNSVAPPATEVDAVCPVCHSELRISPVSQKNQDLPMAQLIRRADQTDQSPPHEEAPHPDLAHMSVEERERHIAQARESHPVSLYPAMKPRLDYVLNGKAPSEKTKPEVPKKKGPDVQSLNE